MPRYDVRDPREIRLLVQRLINARALLTVADESGAVLLLSSVLAVDDESGMLFLDTSPDAAANRQVLARASVHCSSHIDRIDLRFDLDSLQLGLYQHLPAFAVAMPLQVAYQQRREFHRVLVPTADSLACSIDLSGDGTDAAGSVGIARLPVIDISEGGIAIQIPVGLEAVIVRGAIFENATLDLPSVGVIKAALHIRHVGDFSGPGATTRHHGGCEWVRLPVPMQGISQRYIMRIERARQAHDRGLI